MKSRIEVFTNGRKASMNEQIIVKFSMLALVVGRMAQDAFEELLDRKDFPAEFKFDLKQILDKFNTVRKRLNRQLTKTQLEKLESFSCEVADSLDDYIDRHRAIIKEQFVQTLRYDKLAIAVIFTAAAHYVVCLEELSMRLTGRKGVYGECMDIIMDLDEKLHFERLNKGVNPDFEKCYQATAEIFERVDLELMNRLGKE